MVEAVGSGLESVFPGIVQIMHSFQDLSEKKP